ncbi:uncharacterized protein MYCFIDRAFT_59767 [Pseudocercospora fijiensis CIRAD86]|uniref:EDC4-like protein pdc1 beta-propeller domain-containing protein n=1 Tax=Pseudocercospora fijiensis (strain CIRAD86) TaxID=383855 RepID=M3B8D6_PSEFD|nr:uncharacterized protein MYCFIDRAFT_59767 [Pseudocercospora fijiensis CIRAD86]EME85587.1 hypothetical protein MYCFIDRAFT_59767 [Pseudocercospora fijiensis CIRAD86]
MADLQELFSRLKAQGPNDPATPAQQQQNNAQSGIWASSPLPTPHQPPSVSSPQYTPQVSTPDPRHASNVISPVNPSSHVGTPNPDLNRTSNLLNLLKFSSQPGQKEQKEQTGAMGALHNARQSVHLPTTVQARDSVHSRGEARPLSAADLMNSIQRSSSGSIMTSSAMAGAGAERPDMSRSAANSSTNQQDFLLNLLKPKTASPAVEQAPQRSLSHQPDVDNMAREFAQASIATKQPHSSEATPVHQFGSPATTPFAAPLSTKSSMFSYVNPFDQLHSSSPLNKSRPEEQANQPKKIEILKHDRSTSGARNGESPAHKSRRVESVRTASALSDNRSGQSVSQALEGVGEQVDKQVEQALADADLKAPSTKTATDDELVVKKDPIPAADDDVESNWESSEDTHKEDGKVEVYNFPMKPFVSLQIKPLKSVRPIRQDNFMVIAQLKKEFDQIDRSLVTASQTHIVYAQVATKKDNGGFRIIRQDSGDHKQVFRSSGERIFSVQLCTSPVNGYDVETVLGTGVNGSVFWTSLNKSRAELFPDDDVDANGFIMPSVATAEENTSGSPFKTRAKVSSRHPEYFAIARGKNIFIIAPNTAKDAAYCDPGSRKVNSEKYFGHRSFKINTGKAGKDFCFSEDDTVIASLDKNGRFKFWDIRNLLSSAMDTTAGKHDPVDLREPLWQMNAAASGSKPDEKPSVSSIMFLDKERPVVKGSAMRYVIIGFKQNHILQLWDLGLGKAVQEIRLPHEKDSDGICSISYHSKTGIIAVAHPTRNSIYFIHLSAPKYNIPHMEQAKYIAMLARSDPALPKPESTAIMSGLREFSFAKAGQLRSIDMLKTPVENASEKNTAGETLFELYVMHSKGVVGVSIKREDLGWDENSKMLNPKDALKEGVIDVTDLLQPAKLPVGSEPSSSADTLTKQSSKAPAPKKHETPKEPSPAKDIKKEPRKTPTPAPPANGTPRMLSPEPPNKPLPQIPTNPPLMTPDSYSLASARAKSSASNRSLEKVIVSPQAAAAQAATQTAVTGDQTEYHASLSKHFEQLYARIESDKRVQDAAAGAKQDALLRLVSSTLTENVDRSLSSIIANRIESDVIPTLTDVTSRVCDRKIAELLPQQLNASVATAMKASLSNTLQQALRDKEVHKAISEITANHVAQRVQQQVSVMLQQQLPEMTTQAAQRMVGDLENRFAQYQQTSEAQRKQDGVKIDELSTVVRSLSATLQNMATSQTAFQEQILKMQRDGRGTPSASSAALTAPEPPPEAEDEDVTRMTQMLMDGKFEEATIQWISSDRQADIFDKLFVRVKPSYLQSLSPLVALTVSAAITSSFDTYINERLDWLERVLQQVNVQDADIMDVAPKIMDVLSQRLQGAYMAISEERPSDPLLKKISNINRSVQEVRRIAS